MTDAEGVAWSGNVMGQGGPYVRQRAPRVLLAVHSRYVAHQVAMDLDSNDPYGLIWLGLPKALVEDLEGMEGVQFVRPRGGRYRVPVINGVPLVPWRYAKDSSTDIDTVSFGQPVSKPRRALFGNLPVQLEFAMGDATMEEDGVAPLLPRARQEAEQFAAAIRELMEQGRLVAILAYASTPDGIHRCYLGYATLQEDDTLNWKFREEIEIATVRRSGLRMVQEPSGRPAFDEGEPAKPPLRKRSPLEAAPTGAGEQRETTDEADSDG